MKVIKLIGLPLWILWPTCFLVAQTPSRFAEELLTTAVEYGFTISPDQETAYFVRTDSFYVATPRAIYQTFWTGEKWTSPMVASFSGVYGDSSPFISPDGKKLFFTSNRPVHGQEVTNSNIWCVELNEGKPITEPFPLDIVNSEVSEYSPSVDSVGNLYFGSYREGGVGYGDIWWSAYQDGEYQTPQNLGPNINTKEGEWGSCISPDGELLIFENSGHPQNLSAAGDLYLAIKKNGQWQEVTHLPAPYNSIGSDLTPKFHGETLFFASNRPRKDGAFDLNNVDIYQLKLAELLQILEE